MAGVWDMTGVATCAGTDQVMGRTVCLQVRARTRVVDTGKGVYTASGLVRRHPKM